MKKKSLSRWGVVISEDTQLTIGLNNFDVIIYDNLLYEDRFFKNVNFINGDIRDTNFLVQTAEKFDVIVLLAVLVGDPVCSVIRN